MTFYTTCEGFCTEDSSVLCIYFNFLSVAKKFMKVITPISTPTKINGNFDLSLFFEIVDLYTLSHNLGDCA
jgi:hypothetical protein